MNMQDSKVGNIGDILKHAALIALAGLIKKRNAQKKICYLDTHTYNFKSKCSNERWSEEVAELVERHGSAYAFYRDIEQEAMTKGQYLCSSALAVSVLQNPELFLAEKDAETHASLARQLADANLECASFKYDSLEYRDLETPCPCGSLLALVDPFKLNEEQWSELWATVGSVVEVIHHEERDGLIIVFHYSDTGSPQWQEPPCGFVGVVGMIAKPPFYLAVYATEGIADEAQKVLKNLGWDVGDENDSSQKVVAKISAASCGLFDRYMMADYSGARDEGAQKEHIYVADLSAENSAENLRNGFTRDTLRMEIVKILKDANLKGQRVLVGLDHQFGWPIEMLTVLGLTDKSWKEVIHLLASGFNGGPQLDHPNVYCGQFNSWFEVRFNTPGPFYSPSRSYGLPSENQGHGDGQMYRFTETCVQNYHGGNPKSVFEIGTYGAVGGQTICGMLQLSRLIDDLKSEKIEVAFWPFDGLSINDPSYHGKHVVVEIYPTLIRGELSQSDANDAIGSARFCAENDRVGNLANTMNLSKLKEHESRINLEGWILGCTGDGNLSCHSATEINRITLEASEAFHPTDEQKHIIECEASIVRVIARAGTGKTTTMIHRAARIIEQDPSAHVLMLTFTRNAADSMHDKYIAIRRDSDRRFEASTFHGFALKCLLDYGRKISIGGGLYIDLSKVSLLNEFGRQSVMDFYKRGKGEMYDLKQGWEDKLSNAINGQSDLGGRTPFTLLDGGENLPKGVPVSVVWKELLSLYARENLVDFDVIMVLFEYLLRTDSQFLRRSRGKISHAIIDEFQDTNYPQLSSVEYLTGYGSGCQESKAKQVMVVGDDFQIIYDWRGAVSGIFDRFASWGDCVTLPLHESFRSSVPVLTLVNETAHILAKHPDHQVLCEQVPAELVAGKMIEGAVYAADQGADEIKGLISLLRTHGEDDSKISILSFKNDTARRAYDDLCAAGIPCDLVTARPSEIPGVRRFLAFLTIWIKPSRLDFGSWWYLNTSYVGMKASDFEDLWAHVVAGQPLDANTRTIASLFGGGYEESVFKLLSEERLSCVNEAMLLRMVSVLSDHDSIIKNDKVPCERIAHLLAAHEDFRRQPLRVIGEMTRRDFAGNAEVNRTGVQISTIHQYKGLENDAVIVFYDFRSDEAIDKMRLDYVARSRAKRNLVLYK